jgi:UDP-3-O-[3-hydroxymyristoyl] glucosamine N-acyltransferase
MISPSALIANSAKIADSAMIWDFSQVRDGADIGENVVVGLGAYIGTEVKVGSNSKIQNYALIYEPALLEEGVFVGPGAILTNDKFPRAINEDGTRKSASDWQAVGVTVCQGASVGAGAICVAPLKIGNWAMVAAGSVVVTDVPDFALVAGTPARRIGWVCKCGQRLSLRNETILECPNDGASYRLNVGNVVTGL